MNGVVDCRGCLRDRWSTGRWHAGARLRVPCAIPLCKSRYGPLPSPHHSAWSILEGYDLDYLSPLELGASTSTYPPDICKPKLLLSLFFAMFVPTFSLRRERPLHSLSMQPFLHPRLRRYISSLVNLDASNLLLISQLAWYNCFLYLAHIVPRLISVSVSLGVLVSICYP